MVMSVGAVGDIDSIIDKWVSHYQQETPELRIEQVYALIDIESNFYTKKHECNESREGFYLLENLIIFDLFRALSK